MPVHPALAAQLKPADLQALRRLLTDLLEENQEIELNLATVRFPPGPARIRCAPQSLTLFIFPCVYRTTRRGRRWPTSVRTTTVFSRSRASVWAFAPST